MDSFRPQKSPGSDRFLGLLSSSPPSSSSSFEFDEHDIFSTDADPNPNPNPNPNFSPLNPNPSPKFPSPLSRFHRDQRNFGILAALPEDSKPRNPKFLQRKPSISPASSSSTSPRMIPAIPKPKAAVDVAGKMNRHQSAPVNVPVVPGSFMRGNEGGKNVEDDDDDDDDMMLPPHEIVDRAKGKGEPMTTFSVLEGVGRTLKGRDLRRVRNAVWHKTGITVAIKCKHGMKQVTVLTDDNGSFESQTPSNTSPKCHAKLLGGPKQFCSYKQFMISRAITEKGSSDNYTFSTPLILFSSCPTSKSVHAKGKRPKKEMELGSSKTVDLPLPKEWGLAPSSYYVPFFPIIGIP